MLMKIASIAGSVLILTAVAGLVNCVFGTHLGLDTGGSITEIPNDPIFVAVFFVLGALCLIPALLMFRRTA